MHTLPTLVRAELLKNPFLLEMLQDGIVNISAVAARFHRDIETAIGRSVKVDTVGMAVRRSLEQLPKQSYADYQFPSDLEISTKSQVYEVAFQRTAKSTEIANKIRNAISPDKGDFISVVEGTYEIMVFTNKKNKPQVRKFIARQKITSELDDLCFVTVNWAKVTKDIPGIYYRITRALAFRGISIQSFHTIGAEMMIFFKEDVFSEAHQTLLSLLHNRTDKP